MYLCVGSRLRDCNYLYYYYCCFVLFYLVLCFVCVLSGFPPSFVSFPFSFLGFIKFVCGLRCVVDEVLRAVTVECTNMLKKWYGSDCDNRGYQERRGRGFKRRQSGQAVWILL